MPGTTDEAMDDEAKNSATLAQDERDAEKVAGRRTWMVAVGAPILVLLAAACVGTTILLVFDYAMRH